MKPRATAKSKKRGVEIIALDEPEPSTSAHDHFDEDAAIVMLNDDCLLEIFSYFNNEDLLTLSKVCRRFLPVTQQIFAKKFHSVVMYNRRPRYKEAPLLEFFENFGYAITELSMDRNVFLVQSERVLEMVSKFCRCVETLSLKYFVLFSKKSNIKRPYKLFKQITALNLYQCQFENSQGDLRLIFEKCENVTRLALLMDNKKDANMLMERQSPGGYYLLESFANLKELHIMIYYEAFRYNLAGALNALGAKNMLEILDVSVFDMVQRRQFKDTRATKHDNEIFESVLHCKQLHTLAIKPDWALTDEKLVRLSEHLTQLKKVWISKRSGISSDGLTNFIRDCSCLTELQKMNFTRVIRNEDDLMLFVSEYQTRAKGEPGEPLVVYMNAKSLQAAQKWNTESISEFVVFKKYDRALEYSSREGLQIYDSDIDDD